MQLPRALLTACLLIALSQYTRSFCTEMDALCLACDPLSRLCIECANGYLNHKNICQESSSLIDYCFSYQSEGQCRVCQYGYYLSKTGICEEIEDSECIIYDLSSKNCTVCKDSTLPNESGECDEKTECSVPNCKYCFLRGQTPNCIECASGYTLFYQGGIATCIQETPSVSNCNTIYTHDNLKCFICDAPYYNFNGSCLKSELYNLSKGVSLWRFSEMVLLALMVIRIV